MSADNILVVMRQKCFYFVEHWPTLVGVSVFVWFQFDDVLALLDVCVCVCVCAVWTVLML